jgi:hypothetical protein
MIGLYLLASLIAGEAGNCGLEAKLAVVHVVANRQAAGITGGWYGWNVPTELDLAVAEFGPKLADPTNGAIFLFSDADLHDPAVKRIVTNRVLTQRFNCAEGELWAFR